MDDQWRVGTHTDVPQTRMTDTDVPQTRMTDTDVLQQKISPLFHSMRIISALCVILSVV